jgi:FKBP-type peptidyl-prolyl cis-trans isomerase SlyD
MKHSSWPEYRQSAAAVQARREEGHDHASANLRPSCRHLVGAPDLLREISMQISNQAVAAFHYTLTDDQGQVIDSSEGREPLTYLHGSGQIVPGLEKQMEGKTAGDKFNADVAPEEGYGIRHPELMQEVPREAFQGVQDIQPGMQFQGRGPQGEINVTVTKVDGDKVFIDGNHPLAGQTLHFAIEVTSVRAATAEELQHGHVHGEGGHHH